MLEYSHVKSNWSLTAVTDSKGAFTISVQIQSTSGTKGIRLYLVHFNEHHRAGSANISWIPLQWNYTSSRSTPLSLCSAPNSQPHRTGSNLGQCKTSGKLLGWMSGLWHQLLPSTEPLLLPCIGEQCKHSFRKLQTTQKIQFYCQLSYISVTIQ